MISNANILFQIETAHAQTPLRHGDHTVSFLPLCHVAERMGTVYNTLAAGPVIHFPERAETLANDLPEIAPHLLFAPPRFWEKMHARHRIGHAGQRSRRRGGCDRRAIRSPGARCCDFLALLRNVRCGAARLGRLRHALTGAAPVAPELPWPGSGRSGSSWWRPTG
jgi:long-chain acyl-CoA synthetase